MITGEPRWARIIDIHPSWTSIRYWKQNDQKIIELDQKNALARAARTAAKLEAG